MTAATCSVQGCDSPEVARGYCQTHYQQWRRHGTIERPSCSVEGCSRPVQSEDLCFVHRRRLLRHGSVLSPDERASTIDVTADPDLADLADLASTVMSVARLRGELYDKIRAMRADGYTIDQLRAATGYSEQRISQIAPVRGGPIKPHGRDPVRSNGASDG